MLGPTALYQLVLADFRERTRRYSYLLTLAGVFFWGYLVITGKYTMLLGACRGECNSAWVGSLIVLTCTPALGIFGFYLIKNSISRDRRTGVGEILATTPVSKIAYLLSKYISNFLVMGTMILILGLAALVMQLASGVENGFDLWALWAPMLYFTVPVALLVSAVALLFESTRWLRGIIGNILYLMLAEFMIFAAFWLDTPYIDTVGIGLFTPSMEAAARATYPGANLGVNMGFVAMLEQDALSSARLFHWNGITWTAGMLIPKLFWVAVSFVLVGLSTLFLNRFDPAKEKAKKAIKKNSTSESEEAPGTYGRFSGLTVSELVPAGRAFSLLRMVTAELRLMLKGYHFAWYFVALALLVVQLVLPLDIVRTFVLPAAWIWPIALWSAMGTREQRFNTGQLLFSSAFPLRRQLPATWIAGFFVTVLTGSGVALRAAIAGETTFLLGWLVAAFLIPTVALALGVLSGSRKPFEIIYVLICYIGPINKATIFDFMGTTDAALAAGVPVFCLALTLVLLPLTFVVRRVRLAG